MSKLRKIVYLSDAQYQTLITNGSVTSNGQTVVYNANDIYLTPSSNTSSVPSGGSTGQVLMKNSGTDQDVKWGTISKVSQADSVPWSGVSNTPTTLSGYGITDALTENSSLNAAKLTGTIPASCYTDTTYNIATNSVSGLVKPWYTHTAASTGPTTGSNATAIAVNTISTTAGKYYAVEADNDGRLFVNVPWTNVNSSYVTSSGVTSITLSSGDGISVNNSGTAITSTGSCTISLASVNGLTIGTYGPTGSNTTLTPAHQGTFTVPNFTVDTYGRVTSANNYTVQLPSVSDYVQKSGDTMRGNLTLSKSNPAFKAIDSTVDEDFGVYLSVSSNHMTHGVYSTGYSTEGTAATFTSDRKWMVYRDKNGNIILNGTANKATQDGDGNTITSTYVKKAGDTMTGNLTMYASSGNSPAIIFQRGTLTDSYNDWRIYDNDGLLYFGQRGSGSSDFDSTIYFNNSGEIHATKVYGAVWNDYAEFRKDNIKEKDIQIPGKCVREVGDGTLTLTTKRLERGCEIISDTFGFAIGQDEENGYNTPIASNGRVLAYPYESIEEFASHIGYPVCSGPDGTVSIMTDEEEEKYPSRIIGTISEIPSYEEWGTGKVKVNGRVWIRIK